MTPFAGGIPIRPHIKVFPPEKKIAFRRIIIQLNVSMYYITIKDFKVVSA